MTANNAPTDTVEAGETEDVAVDDESIQPALMEHSAESDTDTSKQDAGESMGKDLDGQDSVPRYVVKKSASFKPVSVTKSFLAKAGTVVAPMVKTGNDKG